MSSFNEFSRCASRQTVLNCGQESGAFVARFLLELAGDVVEKECIDYNEEHLIQTLCLTFVENKEMTSPKVKSNANRLKFLNFDLKFKHILILISIFLILRYV